MDQDNPLLAHPFFSEPVIDPNRARQAPALEDRVSALNEPLPDPLTGKEVLKDVGQSALTGLAKGASGVIGGGLGSIGSTVSDVLNLGKGAGAYLGEKMDIISPEERTRMAAEPVISGQTPEQREGFIDPITGLATYKGVQKIFKPAMQAIGADFLTHEPKSPQGKIAETAAEFAVQGAPGALRTLPGRLVVGGTSGAGSELAAQSSQGDEETYNRVVGALAGAGVGAVGSGVAGSIVRAAKALAMPEAVGAKGLAEAYAADLRRGAAAMTPEQVAAAQARGVDISFADMGGPEVKKLLGRAAESSAANQELAAARNEFVNERKRQSGARLSGDITGQFGGNLDAPALQQLQEQSGKLIRDQVYGVARAAPEAQAINQTSFSGLLDRPTFQEAMKRAEKTAVDAPNFGIKPPQTITGTPGTEQVFQQTPRGIVEVPAVPAIPDRIVPGNLSYWDQVQRELRSMSEIEARRGDNTAKATIDAMRDDLLKKLDKVPGYKDARGTAFETFQAASAPEAGAKFFSNMNAFKRSEIKQAFDKMNPEQKELFAAGFASKLNEVAAGGNVSGLAKKFTTDNNFKERALAVLGPERYAKIQGSVMSEDILSKVKELAFIQKSSSLVPGLSAGATGAVGLDALVNGIQLMGPDMAIKAAIGAVVGAAGQTVLSATERRIASTILPLAVSTDPKDTARLGMLAMRSPAVGDILNKFSTAISNTITAASGSSAPREARATGGAVNLMALSKAAKKHVTRSTEDLLNESDDTVARALEVANKHI
jgi:hypothetical protein